MERRLDLWDAMKLEDRVEYDEGDLGLPGAVQVMESVNKKGSDNLDDRIQRFPGEANAKLPWPMTEKSAKTVEEKLLKLDGLFTRLYKQTRDMLKLAQKKGTTAGQVTSQSGASQDASQSKGEASQSGQEQSSDSEA